MFIQQTSHNFKQETYSESDFGRIIYLFFRFEFSIIIYGTLYFNMTLLNQQCKWMDNYHINKKLWVDIMQLKGKISIRKCKSSTFNLLVYAYVCINNAL